MEADLDRLLALANVASPGPWKIRPTVLEPDDGEVYSAIVAADTTTVADVHDPFDEDENNADYIAALDPNTVRWLVTIAKAAERHIWEQEHLGVLLHNAEKELRDALKNRLSPSS